MRCAVAAISRGFGSPDARVVAPGDPARSFLLHRMKSLTVDARMPELVSHVVDGEGVTLTERWSSGLTACT